MAGTQKAPVWVEAEENRFGVRVLDLTPVYGEVQAFSANPAVAAKAAGWRGASVADLDEGPLASCPPLPCALRYPAAPLLPDGLLFTPSCMEEKWVLGHRQGRLIAARSWTGDVQAVATTRREGGALVVDALRVADGALGPYGDVVELFDWLVRSHALGQLVPLPCDEPGLDLLERTPLAGFSTFGSMLVCAAARGWSPPEPDRELRADGALLAAVMGGDPAQVRALAAAGEPLDAPSPTGGYTALCVAMVRKDAAMVETLLELGADPNVTEDRGNFPLGIGIVHDAPVAAWDAVLAAGVDVQAVNDDGFGLLHAAAESGRASAVPWLLRLGLDLERRTGRGHTALHIASALGRLEAVKALVAAGADRQATSPDGTPLEIARREEKPDVVAYLEKR